MRDEMRGMRGGNPNLFVANGKLARRLLVALGKVVQLLHRLALVDRERKLDVGLCVLVAWLHVRGTTVPSSVAVISRIVRARHGTVNAAVVADSHIRPCHPAARRDACSAPRASPRPTLQRTCRSLCQWGLLLAPAQISVSSPRLKHTADEERVAGKLSLARLVLHEEADAVLRVARRVHRLHRDAAQLERLAVLGRLGHALAVLAADDVELGRAQLGQLFCPITSAPRLIQEDNIAQNELTSFLFPPA